MSDLLPCPHCGDFQTLKWSNVRWDDEPGDAYYVCEPCGAVIEHDECRAAFHASLPRVTPAQVRAAIQRARQQLA